MKFATLNRDGREVVAVVSPEIDRYWPIENLTELPIGSMVDLIQSYRTIRRRISPIGGGHRLSDVEIAAPLRPVRNIMCVGKNYRDHAHEFTRSGLR